MGNDLYQFCVLFNYFSISSLIPFPFNFFFLMTVQFNQYRFFNGTGFVLVGEAPEMSNTISVHAEDSFGPPKTETRH